MADIDDNASAREGGNRRRRTGEARPARAERPASWMQVDAEANRIVIDVAAARRGGRREDGADRAAAASPARGRRRNLQAANAERRRISPTPAPAPEPAAAADAPVASETPARDPYAFERPLETGSADAAIPTIPLEPEPQEFGRDLDSDVYIPAEEGVRRRRQRQRGTRKPVTNPFGRIEKGGKPKGRASAPKWQKILMAVCGVAILGIGYIVIASGWVELPGLHRGVQIRTSVVYLSQVITLPYAPKNATWQVLTDVNQGTFGATKERLIAVMEFTPEQAAAIVADAIPMPQISDHQAIESELWFPDAAHDLIDDVDDGTPIYDASVFTTSYFKRGIMLRLGDSGFVIAKMYNY